MRRAVVTLVFATLLAAGCGRDVEVECRFIPDDVCQHYSGHSFGDFSDRNRDYGRVVRIIVTCMSQTCTWDDGWVEVDAVYAGGGRETIYGEIYGSPEPLPYLGPG